MPNAIFESIVGFNKYALYALAQASATSILSDPNRTIYSLHSNTVKIPVVESGAAGDYDPNRGYDNTSGGPGGYLKYFEANLTNDRLKRIVADALQEMAAVQAGARTPSSVMLEQFINNYLASEQDVRAFTSFYSSLTDSEKILNTADDGKIDVDHILGTLIGAQERIYGRGFPRNIPLVAFMSEEAHKNFKAALLKSGGLANSNVVSKPLERKIYLGFDELTGKPEDRTLEITTTVSMFDNIIIVPTQSDRLISHALFLSGFSDDPGQEQGGWIADSNNEDFCNIDIFMVPFQDAAYVESKFVTLNYTYPTGLPIPNITYKLNSAANTMWGNIGIENIGANQRGNSTDINMRFNYGAGLLPTRSKYCLAITSTPGADPAPTKKITITTPSNFVMVNGTLEFDSIVEPVNASDEVTFSATTVKGGVATFEGNVMTATTAGTVEVKATASGVESNKITIYIIPDAAG